MRKVFGIGETILDIIFRNDQPQKAVPGGSVFNGLISLGRLNVPVSFISELGNDRVGDMIRDFMEDNHITTEFVDRFPDGKSPISLAFLDDDKNANYIFYKDYPAQRLEVPLPKIDRALKDLWAGGDETMKTRASLINFAIYSEDADTVAKNNEQLARITDDNLEQVVNLVEWPAAVLCSFEREFLAVPQEALIETMEINQKFFPVLDAGGRLTEKFIGIANIQSTDVAEVAKGYERVIRPRFADAKFFFDEDLKQGLEAIISARWLAFLSKLFCRLSLKKSLCLSISAHLLKLR